MTDPIAPNYVSKAFVRRVIDGDTIVVDISPAFQMILANRTMRLHGIDTMEMSADSGLLREMARKAKEHVYNAVTNRDILIKSVKNTRASELIDSFGRYLAVVYYTNAAGEQVNLNEELLALGLAQKWGKPPTVNPGLGL